MPLFLQRASFVLPSSPWGLSMLPLLFPNQQDQQVQQQRPCASACRIVGAVHTPSAHSSAPLSACRARKFQIMNTMPTCPFALPPLPERSRDPLDIGSHETWFRAYTDLELEVCPFERGPEELKVEHTFRVLEHARAICQGEGFAAPLTRACLLAALYHDLARFAQYRTWHTFKDADSCNHGELGAALVEHYQVLSCEPLIRAAVTRAIALHNAFALPEHLPYDVSKVTEVVRDADKLDILRVMDEHLSRPGPYSPTVVLSLPDSPELFSQTVLDCALTGRVASYTDLTCVNDFRLLLGTWIDGLNFATSRQRLASAGHALHLLGALPDRIYGPARDRLIGELKTLSAASAV